MEQPLPPFISVIVPTHQRCRQLRELLACFEKQVEYPPFEVLVVADGPDDDVDAICDPYEYVRYLPLGTHHGGTGSPNRDHGITHALGEFVAFWDDDNLFEPTALRDLAATVAGEERIDVGVVQVWHAQLDKLIPQPFDGFFVFGNIDTACFVVRTAVAKQVFWDDGRGRGSDFRWITRVSKLTQRVRFLPRVIGVHR